MQTYSDKEIRKKFNISQNQKNRIDKGISNQDIRINFNSLLISN